VYYRLSESGDYGDHIVG